MTERRHNEPRRKKKSIDPLYYSMYVPDDVPDNQIETIFTDLENRMKNNNGESTENIARQIFKENATPDQVPIDVWFSFEQDGDTGDKDSDATFTPGNWDEGDDFVARRHSRFSSSSRKKSTKTKVILIAASQQIEHLGAGVDLWPLYKVNQLDVPPSMSHISDFPNREMLNTRLKVSESLRLNPINIVDRITAKVIHQITGDYCDAIIMDPPFGYNDWTKNRFRDLLLNLERFLKRTFIVVWADPDKLNLIQEVFEQTDYVFCDSIAVEMLDQFCKPYFSPVDEFGFGRESRMAVMFRTRDINRSHLKQQRVKDTGFGTVYENGKSYGRLGMPNSIHEILEIMLPDLPQRKRTFVELWPSFFTRRNGWICIDEKVNPTEEVADELVPEVNTEGLAQISFDDSLINKIVDVDDGKPQRTIIRSSEDILPIIIENGVDDQDESIDIEEIAKRIKQREENLTPVVDEYNTEPSGSSDDE